MAIVKTLIVKGVARFLTDAYMSTIRSGIWNGSTIQVGYGGTGVTSAKGSQYTPVFLSSSGIAPCSVEIPHATKDFKINGVTYAVFTNSTGAAPTIFAPTTLAGTGGYILATNAAKTGLEWVAKPTGNVTTTAIVGSSATATTQISAAQTNPFYNLLEGGAVTRSIQFTSSNIAISSTTGGVISFTAASWAGATSEAAGTAGYMPGAAVADRTKFLRGDGSWVALSQTDHTHTLSIAANSGTNQLSLAASTKYKLTAGGSTFIFTTPPNTWVANAVGVAGYVAAPTKASNPNQVWMTNANGEPAWRTINVATAATELAKVTKTLKVDTWTDMAAVSTYIGTYAIQISSGNVMASGIFTACGGTDSVIDEIPLHVADKGTNTWRPYARISAGQLQMTTNEATGISREYTIKILKLI